jgi:DNA-binding XRE family transcriptional regulator
MKAMEQFLELLQERVPQGRFDLDRPEQGGGSWWLDARLGKQALTVEWRASMGFGVSSLPSVGFGDGPDEFFESAEEAALRVEHLLRSGERTRHAPELALKRLREACQLSQQDLAERMKITQGAVSKIERSPNPSLSMLREWVRALGGDLEIRARFGKDSVKVRV